MLIKYDTYGTKNAFKCFVGFSDNDGIRLLCVRLQQMTDCARKSDEDATMSFRAKNKQLLKN